MCGGMGAFGTAGLLGGGVGRRKIGVLGSGLDEEMREDDGGWW